MRMYNGDYPVPGVDLSIDKPSCRHLGLLILAVLMHREPATVELRLDHPASQIRFFRVRHEHPDPEVLTGLAMRPTFFVYVPELPEKHPFTGELPSDLPVLTLTQETEVTNGFDPSSVNTVVGFGDAAGSARLAELLLNAGLENNPRNEYELEGEAGFRGVGVASAELHIYLPGHIFYDP